MRKLLLGVSLCLVVLSLSRGSMAQQKPATVAYQIVDIAPFTLISDEVRPALTADGRVVHWDMTPLGKRFGRVREGDKSVKIESPVANFPDVYPAAMNARGQVAGVLKSSQDLRFNRAFLFSGGEVQDLGTLGGKFASARGLNDGGNVVGEAHTAEGNVHAFLWGGGKMQDLGMLPGGSFSTALDINTQGQVIGISNLSPNGKSRAFLWENGKMQDLGLLPGGTLSHAHAINEQGDIAGWADTPEVEIEAVLWRKGKMISLGSLGTEPSSAWGLNNRGQVVGTGATARKRMHAFLWEQGKIRDLNDLIPQNSGWTLQIALRINDNGQVLGTGLFQGKRRLFLLKPILPVSALESRICRQRKPAPPKTPVLNGIAPNFGQYDMKGKRRTLREFQGKPLMLFFFCGCRWCRDCARSWGDLQRSHALERGTPPSPLPTVIVFQGDADATRAFQSTTHLEPSQTILLPDKKLEVALAYRAMPCPRAFVLNGEQRVLYTNNSPDDAPQKGSSATILSRAIDALERTKRLERSAEPLPATEAQLRLIPARGMERVTDRGLRFVTGVIDPLENPVIRQEFRLKNEGKLPIRITLQPTCGCTSTLLSSEGQETQSLLPGKEGKVSITLQTLHLKAGQFSKYIYILVEDDPAPVASFEIVGSLLQVASFSSRVVSFGTLKAGRGATQTLEATLDSRFVKGGTFPQLISSASDVEIIPAPEASVKISEREGKRFLTREYTLKLRSNAAIGAVQGEVYFPPMGATAHQDKHSPRDVEAMGGVWVSLAGEIEGRITAMPRVIAFGSVEYGRVFVGEVTIFGEDEAALKGLRAESSSPYLVVHLEANKEGQKRPAKTLVLRVSEKTPVGGLQAAITVVSAQGERLVLPVLLNVFKADP